LWLKGFHKFVTTKEAKFDKIVVVVSQTREKQEKQEKERKMDLSNQMQSNKKATLKY